MSTEKIEVEVQIPDDYVVVDRVVLMKCLSADGRLVWREDYGATNSMELLGMLTTAADSVRSRLVRP